MSATDRAFAALQNPIRRRLLFALLESNPQSIDRLDSPEVRSDDPGSRSVEGNPIQLVHTHLPKLDDWEYIDWNRTTGEISTGSNWDEIAPLLRLLDTHRNELPGDGV